MDQIRNMLIESNLDFLCISESWLNCNVSNDLISISGYSCYRNDRAISKGGSVLIYIRECLKYVELELNIKLECLGLGTGNVIL